MTNYTIDLETEEEIDWLHFGRRKHSGGGDGAQVSVTELNKQGEVPLLQGVHVEGATAEEVTETYQMFTDTVNMTASELRDWADNPCSDKASINPTEVRQRVLHLLETPKDDWGDSEVSDARQVIAFLNRMTAVEQGDATEDCPSDRDISLMNWAYRPDDVDL